MDRHHLGLEHQYPLDIPCLFILILYTVLYTTYHLLLRKCLQNHLYPMSTSRLSTYGLSCSIRNANSRIAKASVLQAWAHNISADRSCSDISRLEQLFTTLHLCGRQSCSDRIRRGSLQPLGLAEVRCLCHLRSQRCRLWTYRIWCLLRWWHCISWQTQAILLMSLHSSSRMQAPRPLATTKQFLPAAKKAAEQSGIPERPNHSSWLGER